MFKPLSTSAGLCTLWLSFSAAALAASSSQTEFFEQRIRPVLVEQCYKCHSSTSEKLKGSLMLDSREAMLKGGDTGPAIEPGNIEKSLLVEAIRWKNSDMQMPPKQALPPEQVADLESWVASGAPWPEADAPKSGSKKAFDLQKRKEAHWCWQAPKASLTPATRDESWPASPIDHFILARLEEKGLRPAPSADRRTLIRRASFDLTGLPPTPDQVESFVKDPSPNAFAKVVDLLLASPHFGERWARHWLDLVRYAETRGHEFDPAIPNAWQYRDYVIRALNADLPYNQFVAEHLAGDLLPPRINPKTGGNEAILGTGFWFLGEESHSPVDIRQDEADRMDNRLDVMGKTFLGLTIGCARCHDHKFDAISQKDYYALQGFLISSGYRQARFETLEANRKVAQDLEEARRAASPKVLKAVADAIEPTLGYLADALIANAAIMRRPNQSGVVEDPIARALQAAAGNECDPLYPFARSISGLSSRTLFTNCPAPSPIESPTLLHLIADYTKAGATPWIQDGFSFGLHPLPVGAPIFGNPDQPLLGFNLISAAVRDSAWNGLTIRSSERDAGKLGTWDRSEQTLRTPEATLEGERLWYLVRGSGRAYAAVNNHLIINGPLHWQLLLEWKGDGERWRWVEHQLPTYTGHRLHVEFSPLDDSPLSIAMVAQGNAQPELPDFRKETAKAPSPAEHEDPLALAGAVQSRLLEACRNLRRNDVSGDPMAADWLVRHLDLFAPPGREVRRTLTRKVEPFLASIQQAAHEIHKRSDCAPAMFDGSGVDEFVLVRGQAKNPGAAAPRRFLEAIAGSDQPPITAGSGRLELANRVIDPANPLTGRVIVNRVWHHLFGRGIVPTVDNFGVLGQPPTHPELLDFLTLSFTQEEGWSLKRLIREILLSRTYQMSSQPADAAAEEADPDNLLFHRMNVRRLEGEAIRDAILAVSGRLDPTMGGPSVPVYLNDFMEGRGRPAVTGPLDGAGRRSIYQQIRRNFLPPMMLAFDMPIPFNAMGRRNVSNVPAQALILMNDPFVVEQARLWAARPARKSASARIGEMYATAFSRPPTAAELSAARQFLTDQSALYGTDDPGDLRIWADLAHVLFNVKEMIYLN